MAQTLDQKRAALAWKYAREGVNGGESKEYKALAKGAPALIMSSGLMPTLVYYYGKQGSAHKLLDHLVRGLKKRLEDQEVAVDGGLEAFRQFMLNLQGTTSDTYLRYTDEALEILKWIRQFVDAVPQGGNGHG